MEGNMEQNSEISKEISYGHEQEIVIGDAHLTIHERDDTQDPITGRAITGSWLWDSALYLSKWIGEAIDANQIRISGATVLELGAGTGLPGLFMAAKGASRVILTDVGALVPGLCANVAANRLEDYVQVII
jgi:predicted nicotinamide N-methyase